MPALGLLANTLDKKYPSQYIYIKKQIELIPFYFKFNFC